MNVKAHESGALGPVRVYEDSDSTGTERSLLLDAAARFFSVQFDRTSTDALLVVTGHLASSSVSTGGKTLFTMGASSEVSTTLGVESTGPLGRVAFNLSGSSTGESSVWLAASP